MEILSNLELARLFKRDKWSGPIEVLTRKDLAKELGVSTRTLRRWEQRGIISKPFNALQGAGKGNHAVYRDPMIGMKTILTKGNDVYIRYVNGSLRWRKRKSKVKEKVTYGLGKGKDEEN